LSRETGTLDSKGKIETGHNTFNFVCRYKEYLRRRNEEYASTGGGCSNYGQRRRGIPEQFGIFYALGGALIMEGILSGCYHICPTNINFQFDTTFMYVIAVLLFLKVYQFRLELH
jgi:hypothetical protein